MRFLCTNISRDIHIRKQGNISDLYTFTLRLVAFSKGIQTFETYLRKQGNTRINISSKNPIMLDVETFIRLFLDWLRLVRGIQSWRYIYDETRKYQVKHFIKGFYESFDMRRCEDEKGTPLTRYRNLTTFKRDSADDRGVERGVPPLTPRYPEIPPC